MRDITGYNAAFDRGDLADYEEAYRLRMRGTDAEDDGDEDDRARLTRAARSS